MDNQNIITSVLAPVLVGMRGSGKSAIGAIIADKLHCSWFDSDLVIETRIHMPFVDYFRLHGEAAFRQIEHDVISELLGRTNSVISTGGGAVLNPRLRAQMKTRHVVWLTCPITILADRIRHSNRPSLTGAPIDRELEQLYAQREPLYREVATYQIDTSINTPEQLADQIIESLELIP